MFNNLPLPGRDGTDGSGVAGVCGCGRVGRATGILEGAGCVAPVALAVGVVCAAGSDTSLVFGL